MKLTQFSRLLGQIIAHWLGQVITEHLWPLFETSTESGALEKGVELLEKGVELRCEYFPYAVICAKCYTSITPLKSHLCQASNRILST